MLLRCMEETHLGTLLTSTRWPKQLLNWATGENRLTTLFNDHLTELKSQHRSQQVTKTGNITDQTVEVGKKLEMKTNPYV